MKRVWLVVLGVAAVAAADVAPAQSLYPNELPSFSFWQHARWKSLIPLVSTIGDVRKVLGDPVKAVDLKAYTAPYPGDEKAQCPVFTYEAGPEWKILIYFVKTGYFERKRFPETLYDRMWSIDLIPKKRLPLGNVKPPALFREREVRAADATWKEYSDGSGLIYKIYSSRTQFGGHQPGDLNRISYTASDTTARKLAKEEAKPVGPAKEVLPPH